MTNQHNNGNTDEGIPSSEGLKVGIVGEFGSIAFLCLHTLVEAKVCDDDSKPSYEARNSCQWGEITKNFARARALLDTHVTEESKARVKYNSNDGQSIRQSIKEYSGCIPRRRQSILTWENKYTQIASKKRLLTKCSWTGEQVTWCGRPSGC